MANFSVQISDELLPALVAEYSLVRESFDSIEEYFAFSVAEVVRQRAQDLKVGPYYEGPINPQFNADGTLFGAS